MPLLGISANVESRFKPVKQDPHRPACEFLRLRGLPADLLSKKTNSSTAARPVKAAAGACSSQWARHGAADSSIRRRAKAKRTLPGRWTVNFGSLTQRSTPHITEGIINALSLFAMGQQAVALVAAATDPAKFDLAKLQAMGSQLVLAF